MARKYGMRSGYVEAVNISSGTVTIPDGSSSASVTFEDSMKNAPAVNITPTASDESPYVDDATVDVNGFTVDGLTSAGEDVVHYIAIDESRY
mgnify:CR=1 FL=1|jgi:hypothetical protein